MAFHLSNLGEFGKNLQIFADRNGYIPEPGDKLDDFDYGDDIKEDWEDFLNEASQETLLSLKALQQWQMKQQ